LLILHLQQRELILVSCVSLLQIAAQSVLWLVLLSEDFVVTFELHDRGAQVGSFPLQGYLLLVGFCLLLLQLLFEFFDFVSALIFNGAELAQLP
jgi:hypothetical protein